MELTLELLIGLMVVLLLMALGLVVYLVRAFRKSDTAKTAPARSPGTGDLPGAALEEIGDERAIVEQHASPASTPGAPVAASPSTPLATDPNPVIPQAAMAPEIGSEESPPEHDAVLLMQVWQDAAGYLLVDVERQRYRRLFEIQDGEVGRRVLAVIDRLVAFSKGQESRVAAAPERHTPPTRSASAEADLLATVDALRARAMQDRSLVSLEQLREEEEINSKKSRISLDPVPFRRTAPAQQRGITLNLAGEIEELLQIRLRASPEFHRRFIHVASAPDGGLRFDVDGTRYAGIDQIPDPQVQALIRAAISDWEAKP